ncbi:histidine phosphatase family protein [Rhodobacteraceae bacterium D3-12]|nr:histidine phosphatase family protein [Rhodobacteraceae bacterium D3-12]
MMTLPPLYFLRHGETDWNRDKRIQGQMESELNERGQGHALRQGEILSGLALPEETRAYCSPQKRTRQTAERALAPIGIEPVFDERLKEVHMGDWQGLYYPDVIASSPALGQMGIVELCLSSSGEGEDELWARAGAFLRSVQTPAIVISHGIMLSFLRAKARGLSVADMETMERKQGVVIELRDGVEVTHS